MMAEMTDAQVVAEMLRDIASLMAKETDTCPYCGQVMTSMKKEGRSVYGSCGCRLWQGNVPEAWLS